MGILKQYTKKITRNLHSRIVNTIRPIRGRRPKMLSVEVTSYCNLNCPFCLVGLQNALPSTEHDLLPRGLGNMDMELFKKIVVDAKSFGIETLQLHFQGEPLLHKQFPSMVRMAKKGGMSTQAFTNGLPLTERMADEIIDAGLDDLRFSVDGVSQEVYEKNRVGGQFERVYNNMKMMAEKARKANSPIGLEWQMIALRNNEHELDSAKEMARDIGMKFFVKTFAVTDPDLVPQDTKYQRNLHIKPCLDIYRAVFVYWNGDVVPCCYDHEGKEIVGNLKNQTLTEVWDSVAYQDLRRRIDNAFHNPTDEPDLCKSCLKWGHEHGKTTDGQMVWIKDIATLSRGKSDDDDSV